VASLIVLESLKPR